MKFTWYQFTLKQIYISGHLNLRFDLVASDCFTSRIPRWAQIRFQAPKATTQKVTYPVSLWYLGGSKVKILDLLLYWEPLGLFKDPLSPWPKLKIRDSNERYGMAQIFLLSFCFWLKLRVCVLLPAMVKTNWGQTFEQTRITSLTAAPARLTATQALQPGRILFYTSVFP